MPNHSEFQKLSEILLRRRLFAVKKKNQRKKNSARLCSSKLKVKSSRQVLCEELSDIIKVDELFKLSEFDLISK